LWTWWMCCSRVCRRSRRPGRNRPNNPFERNGSAIWRWAICPAILDKLATAGAGRSWREGRAA
jgi:hypothetical protein